MNLNSRINASVLYPSACALGESPVWHAERKSCFWVDIERKKIYEYNWEEKTILSHVLEQRVSLIVPGRNGKLVLGLQGGIGKFDPDSGALSHITDMNADWKDHRCNDGACDKKGRLWIGTMELNAKKGDGVVYCVEKNKPVEKKIDNVSISNGLAWSIDNKRLYYTDSLTREIWSFRYDLAAGDIFFEKVAVRIPEEMGMPDGMAMDEEGMLWVALWGGFGIGKWNVLTGQMLDFIRLPVPHVTSCAFAGEDLDQLIITTAREGLNNDQLVKYPESGHVFIVKPGVKGLPRFSCNL